MTPLIVAALATWQAVEVWTHSEIMAYRRAWVEARGGRLAGLMGCPWCLSVWVAGLAWTVLVAPEHPPAPTPAWPEACLAAVRVACRWFVYVLAVSRLANLGNDLTHDYCRTPR